MMKNDDMKWIERILAGDENAFTALVKKYEKQIHAFVWQRVRDYHVAEEITQDTFLRAYEKLGTLRDPNRFSSWLYMIATRRFLTWLGEKRIPMQSLEAMSTAEVEALFYTQYMAEQNENIATEKQREVVEYLLQKLTGRERTVVALHYLSEMSCEEIGDFLEMSPNTVKSRLHRARKRLKKEAPMVRDALGDFQVSDDLMEDIMKWIQMNEPGVAASVGTLTKTSDNILYAVMGYEDIYKLPMDENEWQLVNTDFLRQKTEGYIPIVEHNGTLYIIRSDELFASTDSGKTWDSIAPCPKGHVTELLITEEAFYLSLNNGIFRSDDAGNSWVNLNDGLDNRLIEQDGIRALRVSQDTLFAGTSFGVYRLNAETWEHLQLPVDNIVRVCSLADSEDHIYIAVEVNIKEGNGTLSENYHNLCDISKDSWWIFRSTDGGDSWTDITPTDAQNLMSTLPQIKLLAFGKTLILIGGEEGVVARSIDCGNTWKSAEFSGITPMQFSVNCGVALDENTFYTGGITGIHRSTDGGETWYRFNTRFECRVDNLVSLKANPDSKMPKTLYATVAGSVVKSTDAGHSWATVGIKLLKSISEVPAYNAKVKSQEYTPRIVQISEAGGVLYAKAIRRNCETAYYRFVPDQNCLVAIGEEDRLFPIEGTAPPSRDSGRLMWHGFGKATFPFDSEQLPGQGEQIFFSFSSDPDADVEPLSTQIIRENPKFGAECFLKLLGQGDQQLTYDLMLEGLYGNFAVSGKTYYMEYNYKLFRWKPGDTRWSDTGVEEICELTRENMCRGFKLATLGETVYVGKRDGHLCHSLDGGDNWNDVTSNLPLSVEHFNQIVFADATVHVATDKGVFSSGDGVVWNTITDKTGESVIIESLATVEEAVYGANDDGIYHLQKETGIWEQIVPEIPDAITSLVVDEDSFYVGTEHRGVLRLERANQ